MRRASKPSSIVEVALDVPTLNDAEVQISTLMLIKLFRRLESRHRSTEVSSPSRVSCCGSTPPSARRALEANVPRSSHCDLRFEHLDLLDSLIPLRVSVEQILLNVGRNRIVGRNLRRLPVVQQYSEIRLYERSAPRERDDSIEVNCFSSRIAKPLALV